MNRTHLVLTLSTAVVLALTGCGGGEEDVASDATTEPNPATETGSPTTDTSTPEPTPSPSATLPEAADGTDLDACYDGECEVLVTGPVDIPLDPELAVQATAASVTELDGWVLGVAFTDSGQILGSVTWNDMRANAPGTIYTTYDGAAMDVVACIEGRAVIAISTPG